MKDVDDNPLRTPLIERIDHLGLRGARPRPIIDLTEAFFINFDQHDVAADRLLVQGVASGAQHILNRLADFGHAK